MSIAIVGGLDRLKRSYERKCKDMGYRVKVFSKRVPNLANRILGTDGIVIFTGFDDNFWLVNQSCVRNSFVNLISVSSLISPPVNSSKGINLSFADTGIIHNKPRTTIKITFFILHDTPIITLSHVICIKVGSMFRVP